MPPDKRPLSSNVLSFNLGEERVRVNDRALLERNGRNARTLVKNGPLRVTLVLLQNGGKIAPHRAAGPITVQVLDGEIQSARQVRTTGSLQGICGCWTPAWSTMLPRRKAAPFS